MKSVRRFALAATAMASLGMAPALADGHESGPASARQAHMKLYAFYLDALGAMVKGQAGYDAGAAQSAANNLLALATMDQDAYWAPGTSSAELGNATKAPPAIWQDGSRFAEIGVQMAEAAGRLAAAAGGGRDSLAGAMRDVGGACGACHRNYRER